MYSTVFEYPLSPTFPHSHLVHASDADQAHALLTRWGPDGQGKLGGPFRMSFSPLFPHPLP